MTSKPIFLLATERSGSNLLRLILNAHDEITAPSPFERMVLYDDNVPAPSQLSETKLYKMIRDIMIAKDTSRTANPIYINPLNILHTIQDSDSLLSIQQAYYEEYASIEDTQYWCTKDPGLLENLQTVLDYYTNPKVVYLVRDARDVALSFKNSRVGDFHPYFTASRWKNEQKKAIELIENEGAQVSLVTYEQLLQQPEQTLKELFADLTINFDENVLYYHESNDSDISERSRTHENLSNPIQSDNYNKYKEQLTNQEIKIIESIAGDELRYFGYDLTFDNEISMNHTIEYYEGENDKMRRQMKKEFFINNTTETARIIMTSAFWHYFFFRYGILEGKKVEL